jgi:Bacterial Ig-like domain
MYTGGFRPRRALGAAVAVGAALALLSPGVAFSRAPVAPESLAAGVNVSFLAAGGLIDNTLTHAEIRRNGVLIGMTNSVTPVPDPGAPGLFLAEFNHLGEPGCWLTTTPEFRPGDVLSVVRELPTPDVIETTLNRITAQAPVAANAATVQMHGTAGTPGGLQLPVGELGALIRDAGGGPLRLEVPGQGTIAYDAVGSLNWTATFPLLTPAQVAAALVAPRLEASWTNAAATQIHFYEVGGSPGPANPPCTAPLQAGPSIALDANSDSGVLGDRVTNDPTPTVTGIVSVPLPAGKEVRIYLQPNMVTPIATTTANAQGVYSVTVPLPAPVDGTETLVVTEIDGAVETEGNGQLALTIDTELPGAPTALSMVSASPSNDPTPNVKGTAEAGSTVSLFTNDTCTASANASGSAAAFGTTGIAASAAENATTTFFARATDVAGNTGPCSTSNAVYLHDSIPPEGPVITSKRNGATTPLAIVSIPFTAPSAAGVAVECRLATPSAPNPAYAACSSPFSATAPVDGTYVFTVRTRDQAGNTAGDTDLFVKSTPASSVTVTTITRTGSPSNTAANALAALSVTPVPAGVGRAVPITRGVRMGSDGRVSIAIRCTGPVGAVCKGRVTLNAVPGGKRIASANFSTRAGRKIVVKIGLPFAVRTKLLRTHRLSVRVVVKIGSRTTAAPITITA